MYTRQLPRCRWQNAGKAFPPFGLIEAKTYIEYDLIYIYRKTFSTAANMSTGTHSINPPTDQKTSRFYLAGTRYDA